MKTNENKEKGKMYEMYGNYVQVPYSWYGLCRKYIIPKEIKEFKDKKENSIELNPMEINVLAYLANYDDCYVANGTIAEVFKLKKKTIEKYIKELRWVGFIKTYENKEIPTYTDRRNIYVQHDAIKRVLEFEGDKYRVPYECGVSDDEVPSTCNLSTLQMEGEYPTDVTKVPSTCRSNKKGLENIRNYKKDGTDVPNASDEANTSDEVSFESETNYNYFNIYDTLPMDLTVFEDISENHVRDLHFNSKSHYDMFDDYEFVDKIYEKYIECCKDKRNASSTMSLVKGFMKQYNCDENAIETCVGYFLYQNRKLKRSFEDIKIDFEQSVLAS